ncbi:g12220 [Coccomyxa viridis]|uniref:G12220 protein n=1 Tax=Coccomyxa viridis TaxID=1274662 RepID=A0ABP1GEH0_9CHLO
MLSRRSRARWVAACVLACLSLTPWAFSGTAAQAAAQTDLPPPSQPPSFIQAQRQDGLFKSDGFLSPSYWPIGLWNTPDGASVHPSPAPSPSPPAPGSGSKTQGASTPAQQFEGSAAASRKLQAPDSAPPTSSLRPARLESQSVPARAYSFVASPAVAPRAPARSSQSQKPYGGSSLITSTNADTAPAVAGPAGAPTAPSSVGTTPSPTGSRDPTVTVRPGVPKIAPAPAPASPIGRNASQQSAPSTTQAPSPSAMAPGPSAMAPGPSARVQNATAAAASPTVSAYSVGNVSPSRNPFEPGSKVPSTPVSTPSSGTNSQPAMAGLGIPTLSPNVAGFGVQTPGSSPSPAGLSPTDNSPGSAVASGGGAQPPLNTLAGQFPNASAAAPAPNAASNPYNTLSPDTQLGSLSTMVVELLLTGQQLFPFSAADQYFVASSMNGLLNSYPHLQELSNIGIVAVITPQDSSGNGSTNASNAQPDLALIGIPVSSPYPMPPAARAPAPAPPGLSAALANAVQGNSSNSSTAPAPAPAAAAAAANSSTRPAAASRVLPATTPAPAASNPLGGSLAPATSGRRRLLAGSPTVSYDVGGAQHVAVNLTIRAQDSLIVPIQRTLNESIRGGSFLQTVNNSGLNLEKVEIVLMQQISGPTAPAPAPAPAAPAPLVDKIIGLPVQTAVPPSLGPTAAPVLQSAAGAGTSTSNRNTIIIAVVCVVGAAVVFAVIGAAAILWHRARRNRKVAKSSVRKHDSEEADIDKVERNGFHSGGWAEGDRGGGPGAGKQRGPAGVVAIRTDDGEQGASYAGISPDSVGAGQDLANGMASPARRHPSGISDWGTGSDGTNLNSRDQLLSQNKRRSSNAGNGSPHGLGRMQQDGRPPGLHMYDSAAESSQPAQRSSSNGPLGRNGSGPGMHDFARQGTLAGEASLPSDVETPHSRNGSTPSSIGRLQRIGAAQLWQVSFEQMQIQKQIGEGSFGKVYLAKWKETTVAVKILTNPNGSSDDDFPTRLPNPLLQSLEKEAGMMAAMRHPNVVLYLGVCLDPPCVVTEYCARGSLNDVLKRALYNPKYAEQLDWRVRLSMALDAAKGMNYLHTSDPPVIHRDLKSPNLLVDKHWRVKVCDFNLSRVMEESAVLSSMAATNPRWLAPEILAGRGYTFSSDVYSFGIILWEFLTWRVPWHEFGPWQVVAMVTDGHQRPEIPQEQLCPSASFPGMGEYVKLMQSCWEQEARKRPTFAEIIQVLRKLFGEEARRNPATGPGEMMPERSALQASTSGGSGEMSQKAQQALLGSSGELQNGHRHGAGLSGEQLPGLAGLRFHMSHDRRSGSGQHLMPGSPNPGERSDPAVLSGQHGRSESMGSESAHLQAYVTRHASVAAQQSESARVAESPRTSDHVLREGSGLPPLARREGQDGSGQLSSNGDWPQDPRDRIAAAHAVSDTSSQHDATFSPPDSRTHSMREYTHSLPPVGEGHERESGTHDSSQHADGDVRRPAA